MPNQSFHPNVIPKGKVDGRKHRTKREKDALAMAAEAFERKSPASLKAPTWLNRDARAVWDRKIKEINGLRSPDVLLDPLDNDLFANWCDLVASYQSLAKNGKTTVEEHKLKQSYATRIQQGADKLGFSPASRARLIRKHAEGEDKDNFGKEFD